MTKDFLKMHGLGNDFAVFDGRGGGVHFATERIRSLADRKSGIGFDQMVVVTQGDVPFMSIYNADGTEVSACGNATRCVAHWLMQEGGLEEIELETRSGRLRATREAQGIKVDMGAPKLDWRDIPAAGPSDYITKEWGKATLVSMGNPHAVFFVPDAVVVDLENIGPVVENAPFFPERTNVEVVQVLSPDRLRMRVWERGAGITLARGTGACASVVAGVLGGVSSRRATVVLDGGELQIEWRDADDHVLMTGPAVTVYKGTLT